MIAHILPWTSLAMSFNPSYAADLLSEAYALLERVATNKTDRRTGRAAPIGQLRVQASPILQERDKLIVEHSITPIFVKLPEAQHPATDIEWDRIEEDLVRAENSVRAAVTMLDEADEGKSRQRASRLREVAEQLFQVVLNLRQAR